MLVKKLKKYLYVISLQKGYIIQTTENKMEAIFYSFIVDLKNIEKQKSQKS